MRVPILMETDEVTLETYNHPDDDHFVGFNYSAVAEACSNPIARRGAGGSIAFTAAGVVSWCDACVHAVTGSVDPMTMGRHMESMIGTMALLDWLSLGFASIVVALSCVAELQDIQLVGIASAQARSGDNLSTGWRRAIAAIGGVRRWVLLPFVPLTALGLVVSEGGDAKSVLLNTVSILFILDLDNIVFAIGLTDRWRERLEVAGSVELDEDEEQRLTHMKLVHISLLSLVLPTTAAMLGADIMGRPWDGLPMLMVWWVCGLLLVESGNALAHVTQVTVSTLLGFVGMIILLLIGGMGQAQ